MTSTTCSLVIGTEYHLSLAASGTGAIVAVRGGGMLLAMVRPTTLLIVCHGNLCRSPMAQALVRHWASNLGASERIVVDSAGTRPFQPGGPAHPQTLELLQRNGIDPRGLVCR